MSGSHFTDDDADLLMSLMEIDTVTPMETGRSSKLTQAADTYADMARAIGMQRIFCKSPPAEILDDAACSLQVHEMYASMKDDFLQLQPSQVLSTENELAPESTIMFNVHLDTVSEHLPVYAENEKIFGRGAVDMKGPAVALLAGIRRALSSNPSIVNDIRILLQCVSGEEGGAMGVYGTKWLSDLGFTGRLNIFCEPSNGVFFDRSTSSMTLKFDVQGEGATDDAPTSGHNATLLLSYLAQYIGEHLAPRVFDTEGKMTIGGISTGTTHNRVFGTGSLFVNFAYHSTSFGEQIFRMAEECVKDALSSFTDAFETNPIAHKTVCDLNDILTVQWVKKGLPVLNNRDPEMENLFSSIELARNPNDCPSQAFTCDAMWAQSEGSYTIVFGPGSLQKNGAHTDKEFIARHDLDNYAKDITSIINAFHCHSTKNN